MSDFHPPIPARINRAVNNAPKLRDRYRYWRLLGYRASEAHRRAGEDFRAGKARYPGDGRSYATPRDGESSVRWISNPASFGLREVGTATAEPRDGPWHRPRPNWQFTGWFTDPHGDHSDRDGTGLCWGIVYQLPARGGRSCYVAGYVMGGCSENTPTVDFGRIFEGEPGGSHGSGRDDDGAREALRAANDMAEKMAEREREYQSAWQAGAYWQSLAGEIAAERKNALAILRERRAVKADPDAFPTLCATIRGRVQTAVAMIAGARAKQRRLARGDGTNSDDWALSFCLNDARLREAFNEGASNRVLAVG